MNQQTQAHGEKLQKILARAGIGSRRAVEEYIAQGLVKVNGRTAQLGDRALATDQIKFKDKPVRQSRLIQQPTEVILYNKPEGRVCTRKDEKGRKTIFEQLPHVHNGRWISIGRLDLNTSGLLILTNNGELANRMMHPSYEMEREYTVRVFGEISDDIIKQIQKGVKLDDGEAKFNRVIKMQKTGEDDSINNWYRVTLKEGRYREVRRIWEAVGVQVSRLHRIRYGEFSLPRNLRKGKTQELTWRQINQLLKSVGMQEEARPDLRKQPASASSGKYTKPKTSLSNRNPRNKGIKGSERGNRGNKKLTIHDLSEGTKPKRK